MLKGYTSCEAILRKIVEIRSTHERAGTLERLRVGFFRRQWRKGKILARSWFAGRCLALPVYCGFPGSAGCPENPHSRTEAKHPARAYCNLISNLHHFHHHLTRFDVFLWTKQK